jgi:hypothetical protein
MYTDKQSWQIVSQTARGNEMTTVHEFFTMGQACDASQCRDEIKDGDVLSVPSENALAIMVKAWPVAIRPELRGEAFHALEEGVNWEEFEDGKYAETAKALI